MKVNIPENLFTVKEADPQKVRKQLLSGRNINMKTVAILFCAAVFLLALLSAVVIKSETDKEKETTASETLTDSAFAETFVKNENTEAFNMLLAFTKDGNDGLQHLSVLHADPVSSEVKITFIPVNAKITVNNYEGTMKNHLKSGGITELLWAVGEYSNISIPYYIYCDEENFSEIMRFIGETEILLEKQINHDYNGINFIIEKGMQKLTGDMMLRYFVYLCDRESLSQKEICNLYGVLFKKLVSHENPQSVSDSFDGIINSISTNISAMDIANNLPLILSFSRSASLDNITIVDTAESF